MPSFIKIRPLCKTLLLNCGIHRWNSIPPWDDIIALVRKTEHFWQPYYVYGKQPHSNLAIYTNNGGGREWHPEGNDPARGDALLDCFREIETVIEGFMGSGPVLKAARRRGIKGIGIESSAEYCEKFVQDIT